MHTKKEFMRLSADYKECRDVLVALGDENRLNSLTIRGRVMKIRIAEEKDCNAVKKIVRETIMEIYPIHEALVYGKK